MDEIIKLFLKNIGDDFMRRVKDDLLTANDREIIIELIKLIIKKFEMEDCEK